MYVTDREHPQVEMRPTEWAEGGAAGGEGSAGGGRLARPQRFSGETRQRARQHQAPPPPGCHQHSGKIGD